MMRVFCLILSLIAFQNLRAETNKHATSGLVSSGHRRCAADFRPTTASVAHHEVEVMRDQILYHYRTFAALVKNFPGINKLELLSQGLRPGSPVVDFAAKNRISFKAIVDAFFEVASNFETPDKKAQLPLTSAEYEALLKNR